MFNLCKTGSLTQTLKPLFVSAGLWKKKKNIFTSSLSDINISHTFHLWLYSCVTIGGGRVGPTPASPVKDQIFQLNSSEVLATWCSPAAAVVQQRLRLCSDAHGFTRQTDQSSGVNCLPLIKNVRLSLSWDQWQSFGKFKMWGVPCWKGRQCNNLTAV